RLAEWAHGLESDRVPSAVMDDAALRVLDTIGCALAGSREEHVPAMHGLVSRWHGTGPASLWGSGLTAAPPQAALANGALAHGLDFDDTHADSVCHVSAVIPPTVLALAGSDKAPGPAALTASATGSARMIRAGMGGPRPSPARPRPPP